MPAGLQVFNADGSLHIDITTRLTRFVGTYLIDANITSGVITNPGFSTGQPFCFPYSWSGAQLGSISPRIIPYGDRIEWVYPDGSPRVSVNLLLGVF